MLLFSKPKISSWKKQEKTSEKWIRSGNNTYAVVLLCLAAQTTSPLWLKIDNFIQIRDTVWPYKFPFFFVTLYGWNSSRTTMWWGWGVWDEEEWCAVLGLLLVRQFGCGSPLCDYYQPAHIQSYTLHLQHPQTNNRIWLNETEDHPCGNMTLFGCESRLRTYWHFLHWRRFILLFCLDKWKDWFQTKQKWCVAAPWRIGSTFVGRSTSPSPPVTSCGCIEDRHIKNRFLPSTTFLFCFSKQS